MTRCLGPAAPNVDDNANAVDECWRIGDNTRRKKKKNHLPVTVNGSWVNFTNSWTMTKIASHERTPSTISFPGNHTECSNSSFVFLFERTTQHETIKGHRNYDVWKSGNVHNASCSYDHYPTERTFQSSVNGRSTTQLKSLGRFHTTLSTGPKILRLLRCSISVIEDSGRLIECIGPQHRYLHAFNCTQMSLSAHYEQF